MLNNRGLRINANKCLYEKVIVPTALYGAEAWGVRSAERRKVNVLVIKCVRSLVGVSRMDRVRNEEVRRRAGRKGVRELSGSESMREWMSAVWLEECRCRKYMGGEYGGRQRLGCMDSVKVALGSRCMTLEATRQCSKEK